MPTRTFPAASTTSATGVVAAAATTGPLLYRQPMTVEGPQFRDVAADEAERANRADWDAYADEYQAEHGDVPARRRVRLVPGGARRGRGAAARRGRTDGASSRSAAVRRSARGGCALRAPTVVAFDLSHRQLQHARRIDDETRHRRTRRLQATVTALPFADDVLRRRVLGLRCAAVRRRHRRRAARGGASAPARRPVRLLGRAPGPLDVPRRPDAARASTVTRSYFDRTPYVEVDDDGAADLRRAAPHARRLGRRDHRLRDAAGALLEPEWPAGHDRVWGGWGPERGASGPGHGDLHRRPQWLTHRSLTRGGSDPAHRRRRRSGTAGRRTRSRPAQHHEQPPTPTSTRPRIRPSSGTQSATA